MNDDDNVRVINKGAGAPKRIVITFHMGSNGLLSFLGTRCRYFLGKGYLRQDNYLVRLELDIVRTILN